MIVQRQLEQNNIVKSSCKDKKFVTLPIISKNQNQQITFVDLFAGIGGFHLSLHNMGATCVYVAEWDDKCRETYKTNYQSISPNLFDNNDNHFARDITKINPLEIPNHDILCAGFPCQPFSISGKQKGFEDKRGTLFFNILEIIRAKKPKVIFLENVKHLINHNNKNTIKTILSNLESIGYQVSYQILNAKDFGTAQNRERIIIIASLTKRFDFSKLQKSKPIYIKDILDKQGIFDILDPKDYTILPKELWTTQKSGLIFCGYRNKNIRTRGVRQNTQHLSRVHKQPNRIYSIEGTHPTIPSQETSGRFWIYDGKIVRRLTINECYKLQGFPESFIKNNQLCAAYHQIGNSVAIPMIESVYSQIKEQLL